MNCETYFEEDRQLVEAALDQCFTDSTDYAVLLEAMRYSLLAGGKRIRPILVLESCRACGGDPGKALPLACALEMVHTYSLIHDDLPCMDNDDYRRGRLTCHKVYGEAVATLAGDGLLTAAFAHCIRKGMEAGLTAEQTAEAAACLSEAAGEHGMVAGQILDLSWEARADLSRAELEQVHARKTGALLRCACRLGCIAANGTEAQDTALKSYASAIGVAFQVRDDILDVTSTQETLGKPIGSDAENGKTTFVTLLGIEDSQRYVEQLTAEAKDSAGKLPEPEFLCWLADYLAARNH